MNKKDNDRMYATLLQNRRDMEAQIDAWSEQERLIAQKSRKLDDIAFKGMLIIASMFMLLAMAVVGVDLYMKIKNNGTRTINAIELNGGKK